MNKNSLDTSFPLLLEELGLGDQVFTTEKSGVYELPMEEGVVVTFSPILNGCLLKCVVASYPEESKQEAFAMQAMAGNFLGRGTFGGVLGLTPDGKTITLTRVIPSPFIYKEFRGIVEDFLNAVDFWRTAAADKAKV